MDLCHESYVSAINTLSRFVTAFLPRSKCLLISWLQSLSTVILEPKKRKSVSASTFHPLFARQWHPTPVLLPGKSHGWRSLVGCSPWGRWESDTTERLHFHFSLSCTGEGNGNPLQRSCLENPRDGGSLVGCQTSMGSHRVGHDWSDLAAAAAVGLDAMILVFLIFSFKPALFTLLLYPRPETL